jgi:hypothetical protein
MPSLIPQWRASMQRGGTRTVLAPWALLTLCACTTNNTYETAPGAPGGPANPATGAAKTEQGQLATGSGGASSNPPGSAAAGTTATPARKATGRVALALTPSFLTARASFSKDGPSLPSNCKAETIGPCVATTCDLTVLPDQGETAPNAGVITVAPGNGFQGMGLELDPAANGMYPGNQIQSIQLPLAILAPVVVSAKGADVPPFIGSAVMPMSVRIGGSYALFSRHSPLNLTWEEVQLPGATDSQPAGTTLNVTITTSHDAISEETLDCDLPKVAGKGVGAIPAEALAKLEQANNITVIGTITFGAKVSTTFSAGGYDITFSVIGNSTPISSAFDNTD